MREERSMHCSIKLHYCVVFINAFPNRKFPFFIGQVDA